MWQSISFQTGSENVNSLYPQTREKGLVRRQGIETITDRSVCLHFWLFHDHLSNFDLFFIQSILIIRMAVAGDPP